MNGFITIHTHIFPMEDDGAKRMDEPLEVLSRARMNGTRMLLLTPHYRGVFKKNDPDHVQKMFLPFSGGRSTNIPGAPALFEQLDIV